MAFDVKKGELPFLDRDTDSQTKTRITEANLCRSFSGSRKAANVCKSQEMGTTWDAPSSSPSKIDRDNYATSEIQQRSAFTPAATFPKRYTRSAWLTKSLSRDILFHI